MALSGGDGGGGSSGAVRAGGAYVELGTKDDKLLAGLAAGKRSVAAWAASAASVAAGALGAGTAAAVALAGGLKAVADRYELVGTLSKRFGDSPENFSRLAGAAELAGVSLDDFAGVLENLPERIEDAALGGGEASEVFKRMGLDARAFMQVPLADRFALLADGLAQMNDVARTATLGRLFSDQGQKLDALLAGGSGGLRGRMADADAAGLTVTSDAANRAAASNRALAAAWLSVKGTTSQALAALLPSADVMNGVNRATLAGVQANREYVQAQIAVVGTGVQVAAELARGSQAVGLANDITRAGMAEFAGVWQAGLAAAGVAVNGFADDVLKTMDKVAAGIVLSINSAFQTVSKSVTGLALIAGRSGFTDIQNRLNTLAGAFSVAGPAAGGAAGVGLDSLRAGFGKFQLNAGLATDFLGAGAAALLNQRVAASFRDAFGGKGGGGFAAPPAVPGFVGGASRGGFLGGGPSALATLGGSVPQQQLNVLKEIRDGQKELPKEIAAATQLRAT